ncbi:MAG: GerMN domain-containing protein [Proteobacteria bacterium]|nr:GerMN domain-containing protein [Pseudomonadota bacterium]
MGNKKYSFYLALILVTAFTAIAVLSKIHWSKHSHVPKDGMPLSFHVSPVTRSNIYLYFTDTSTSFLMAEERSFINVEDPAQFAKSIVEALIAGPKGSLMRTIPSETTLRALYLSKNGTAYVDLSENIKTDHPGGSRLEYFTVFSIVNSLIVNIPQIKAVKFLLGGNDALTLSGHIDIKLPFKANMLLVR